MKKTNMDLIVGGSIIIALLILIVGTLWLKEVSISRKMVNYTVLFPNVGTLQIGDPVMVNGVSKGAVKSIELRGTEVATTIDLDKKVTLSDSTRITVQNIGLMGERGIGIQLTALGTPVVPNTKTDTIFIRGKFDTGIAEAMGMMGTVLAEVETLASNVSDIVEGTIGDTSFSTLFHVLVQRIDTLTRVTENLIVDNKPALDQSFKNINSVSVSLKNLLERNENKIDSIVSNGETLTDYSLTIAARVETLTVSVQNIVDQVQKGEGSLGMLVKDQQFYVDIKRTVANLDSLVNQVQNDALKLRIIGFGKKQK